MHGQCQAFHCNFCISFSMMSKMERSSVLNVSECLSTARITGSELHKDM